MKKGQAATEFLTTYAWVIIVVLLVVIVLSSFGVFSSANILPERTLFKAPLPSIDTANINKATGEVTVAFRNSKSQLIQIIPDGFEVSTNSKSCQALQGGLSDPGAGVSISPGTTFLLTWDCSDVPLTEERFDAELSFRYLNEDSTLIHKHKGIVQGKVS